MRILTSLLTSLLCASACAQPATQPATRPNYVIGTIASPAIPESSGISESRRFPGAYWTHNDSGNPPQIFALRRDGTVINTFDIAATNRDWEDIAIDDDGHLFIGEIGNNGGRSRQLAVYRIDEPDPNIAPLPGSKVRVNASWQLRFPKEPFDCESLFIWKDSGYVISKLLDGGLAGLYRFSLAPQQKPAVLELVAELPIRAPCTAADISSDGKFLGVQSVIGPYLFQIDGDIKNAGKITPGHVMFLDPTMEAVCFVKEGLLATTELRRIMLFPFEAFGKLETPQK